jgi:hypothetical protein
MRVTTFASLPLLAALAVSPASAQISARIHIDIPIGDHRPVVVHRAPPPREIVVVPYDARRFGDWRRNERRWSHITLYVSGGRYYEQPWRDARAVTVYRYRNQYFFAPRDRDWDRDHDRDRYRDQDRDWGRGRGRGRGHDPDTRWSDDRQAPRPLTPYLDRARPRF